MSSDITKCPDTKCPSRNQCRHYLVKPTSYQSYADFNRHESEKSCSEFWLHTPKEKETNERNT